ncbi:unnamed protein product [Lampetra planeri]
MGKETRRDNGKPTSSSNDGDDEGRVFVPSKPNKPKAHRRRPKWTARKILTVVAVVSLILLVVTGIIAAIWYFGFYVQEAQDKASTEYRGSLDEKVARVYTGSVHVRDMDFSSDLEDMNSPAAQRLAATVSDEVKEAFTKSTVLASYYNTSQVVGFSEGSVKAYYLIRFAIPEKEEAVLSSVVSEEVVKGVLRQRLGLSRMQPGQGQIDVASLTTSIAPDLPPRPPPACSFQLHAVGSTERFFRSPNFENGEYPFNSRCQWLLRADAGKVLLLTFVSFMVEDDCRFDAVTVYDFLSPAENRTLLRKCGVAPVAFSLLSSGNVMLVTFTSNDVQNEPGFNAKFVQIDKPGRGATRGGGGGNFTSPAYPTYYPPNTDASWVIQTDANKQVRVTFTRFKMREPGIQESSCLKDYMEVNKKRYCSDQPTFVAISSGPSLEVKFHSDESYSDRGFVAEYTAYQPDNPCPGMFTCNSGLCLVQSRQCDGWNDCGDLSDENNCECGADQFSCANGLCKPKMWMCDRVNDCGDFSDEKECREQGAQGGGGGVQAHLTVIKKRLNESLSLLSQVPRLGPGIQAQISGLAAYVQSYGQGLLSVGQSYGSDGLVPPSDTPPVLWPERARGGSPGESDESGTATNEDLASDLFQMDARKAEQFNVWAVIALLVGIVVVTTVVVGSLVLLRRKAYRPVSTSEVDEELSHEERHLTKMQQNGYENPTYKLYEALQH